MKFTCRTILIGLLANVCVLAQNQAPQGKTAKEIAPVDLTGYWVSVISEDWRWRMVTPLKGDFASIPINAEGKKVGETWDPAKDEAAQLQCKSYGAPAIMRVPGRAHITWADDNTLKIETDAGTQTRLFHFTGTPAQGASASWQGYSAAHWERPPESSGPSAGTLGGFASRVATQGRGLEVTTMNLRPGYLRKNGVPYSAQATVSEFYDYHKEPNGDEWFTVTTAVHDPVYLTGTFLTSTDFKKQRDAANWNPTACTAR